MNFQRADGVRPFPHTSWLSLREQVSQEGSRNKRETLEVMVTRHLESFPRPPAPAFSLSHFQIVRGLGGIHESHLPKLDQLPSTG